MEEDYMEILSAIEKFGGLVILAFLFVYVFFTDRKKQEQKDIELKEEKKNNNAVLSELSASNRNIAESLNLLKTSIDNNTTEFKQHDERAIQQFNVLNEKLIKINEKLTKK